MAEVPAWAEQKPQQREEARLKVMVVDPQSESRSLLKAALRGVSNVGSIRDTGGPQNVLSILAEQTADVIFIEQNLEDNDVFEFVKQVRSEPSGANTKFVLMSAELDMESRRMGMEAGILGYLAKPYDIRGLESAIRDAMGKVSTNHKETLDRVRRISFFSDFSDLELVRLLKICHTRKFSAGDTIFSEGEMGDRFYILISGKVEITKQRKDHVESLATINAGECFGEMAIVDAEPRSADVRAVTDASLIEVNAQIIKDVNDNLALKIFRKLAILVTQKLRSYTSAQQSSE
ncbi:MAG: cyclic nucleotide-binding domain-containing protein [SAR324 cluster bacterium]|nr:cyclic nucleotide-binding domain-containing protein [SAR324 cluster bacterium]MCZ6841373.1 cyclic nucleotide-binding domain-containing protein [SAR324 cluster bacterium]